mmetsp:Transcript_52175/g.167160  ORF Transcript_52175/g.167160 Transcript_52175/m.167160 type:complete len:209 (-) Transcript_52175:1412-2038(-)
MESRISRASSGSKELRQLTAVSSRLNFLCASSMLSGPKSFRAALKAKAERFRTSVLRCMSSMILKASAGCNARIALAARSSKSNLLIIRSTSAASPFGGDLLLKPRRLEPLRLRLCRRPRLLLRLRLRLWLRPMSGASGFAKRRAAVVAKADLFLTPSVIWSRMPMAASGGKARMSAIAAASRSRRVKAASTSAAVDPSRGAKDCAGG